MMSKWLATALAAAVVFATTLELGCLSARPTWTAPVRVELFAPELGVPSVPDLGADPPSSTTLTR